MSRRGSPTCVRACLAAGVAALALASTAAQDARPAAGARAVVADLTAPAIDRGLRANDPLEPPRTSRAGVVRRAAGDGEPFLRGSLIVKFRLGTTAAARRALLALVGGAPAEPQPGADFDLVSIDLDTDPEAAAARLAAQPDVEYAQPRYLVRPLFRPNDPFYSFQWGLPAIDMERAWDINPGATPAVTVAVIDSGVAYRSALVRFATTARPVDGILFPSLGVIDVPFAGAPDLVGPDRIVAPRDFIWDDLLPFDMDGHGTHVAGTIGQLTNNGVGTAGVAFNVRLMPVKAVGGFWDEYFGSPFQGTDDVVARAVRYAADNGATVINMSIGRSQGGPAPAVQDAVRYAVSRGAFVAASAGNEFLEGNPVGRLAEFAPQVDGMVAVGAVNRDRRRASYSSTGAYVELVAPGGDFGSGALGGILQQTYDLDLSSSYFGGPFALRAPRFDAFAFHFFQGTSMAAPHVAGFAALLMQQGVTDPAAVEAVMKRTATDIGPSGRDDEYGHGLINPRAALRGMGLAR